jgi:hypothetical protein
VKVFFVTSLVLELSFPHLRKNRPKLRKRFPSIAPTRWQYHSRLVEAVHEYRDETENLLLSILEEPEEWDVQTISSVSSK